MWECCGRASTARPPGARRPMWRLPWRSSQGPAGGTTERKSRGSTPRRGSRRTGGSSVTRKDHTCTPTSWSTASTCTSPGYGRAWPGRRPVRSRSSSNLALGQADEGVTARAAGSFFERSVAAREGPMVEADVVASRGTSRWSVAEGGWKKLLPDLPDDVIELLADPVVVSVQALTAAPPPSPPNRDAEPTRRLLPPPRP